MNTCIIIILLSAVLYTGNSFSQSSLTILSGATLGVLSGTDLCANTIYGQENIYGGGTICGGLVAMESEIMNELPKSFALSQNYPNPFNPETQFNYQLPLPGIVSIKIYDQLGREVYSLFEGEQEAGYYKTRFNGKDLASGIYYYRLTAYSAPGNISFAKTLKMTLIK
jgi:hypothetical protein